MTATELDRAWEVVSARLASAKSGLEVARLLTGALPALSADDLRIDREGWAKVASAGEDLIAAGAQLRRIAQAMQATADDALAKAEGRAA